jgi:Alpha-L-arabinofuranosidase B (ABFB) domain
MFKNIALLASGLLACQLSVFSNIAEAASPVAKAGSTFSLPLNAYKSFQVTTSGYTNRSLRHRDVLGFTDVVDGNSGDALKQDATYKIVPGLADGGCYSLESKNAQGRYLRHSNSRIRQDARDGSPLFDNDATWCARPGLSGVGVSLESLNYPGRYLRHIGSELWMSRSGGPLPSDSAFSFNADVSWNVINPWSADTTNTLPTSPVAVKKTLATKVYAHMMPWFESKDFSGYWGQHWTMTNQNPDIVDGSGRRQIAAHFYPLTGPYASADPDIIEYQLLLMKLSGIDGVLIDWPGTTSLYDYPRNKFNSEAMIARSARTGLQFGIIYEDQNINIAANLGVVGDKIGQAKADMVYLQNNYFSQGNYINVNGRPLFGVFGPQTFRAASDWSQIFSAIGNKPCFLTLWYQHDQASGDCTGEYSWVYQDAGRTHLQHLRDYYASRPDYGVKMGSAYPGFKDFYAQGGWGSNNFFIAANGTATFNDTLSLAISSGSKYIQLATWNDYGEGTMIEPTREFGYGLLTLLQQKLGVPYGQSELELVYKLFEQRRQYKGNATQQTRLDRAAAYLAALQIDNARAALASAF